MSSSIPFGKVHDDDDVDDNVVSLVGGNGDGVVFIMVVATSGIDVVDDSLILLFCSCSCDDDDMLFRFVSFRFYFYFFNRWNQARFVSKGSKREKEESQGK